MERLTKRELDGGKAMPYDFLDCNCEEYCQLAKNCCYCIIQDCYNKLAKYEDAEEQGRLIEIPANYKDAVFSLDLPHLHISQLEFYGMELMAIGSKDESRYIIAGKNGCAEYFNAEHIGETIFFSNEEAEAKLKEMEVDNHGDS